ncbi:hypothetical protein [Psychrobacter aestuarii]|uniref:Lipoprotein n=1 Tax=Psychrobacter aestuarii TaxID=556327 RepID=A0ABN0VKS9_9GAMM|nr:hypothetical protein [Psychrobacter aestuarii]
MRLTSLASITALSALLLIACTPNNETNSNETSSADNASTDTAAAASGAEQADSSATDTADTQNADSAQGAIDWTKLDTGVTKVAPSDYDYSFAPDSQPVRAYVDYFGVDTATAQYNLTVSMASNEALSKLLDQLSTDYVSHEIIDGNDLKLLVHTTDAVPAATYDYVIAGDFGKGLVLPIEIVPDGVKDASATDKMSEAHAGS